LSEIKEQRGEKTGLVIRAVESFSGNFSVADILKKCPGVSIDMVRRVLKNLRADGRVECLGRGKNARWKKIT